jgi:hypothetical protein
MFRDSGLLCLRRLLRREEAVANLAELYPTKWKLASRPKVGGVENYI